MLIKRSVDEAHKPTDLKIQIPEIEIGSSIVGKDWRQQQIVEVMKSVRKKSIESWNFN